MNNKLYMSEPQLPALRDAAIELISRVALPLLQAGPAQVLDKAQTETGIGTLYDIVTDVDTGIENALLPPLQDLLPGSLAVGEEGFKQLKSPDKQPIWLLDPLDGTLNFARGLPGFGLSLALLVDAAPVLGIVFDGKSGEIFDALAGQGARFEQKPLMLDDKDTEQSPLCLSSGVWNLIAQNGDGSTLAEVLELNSRIRLIGSQALQLCYVASGALCLNVNREARLWDDAAGALIVREAGGHYERLGGESLFPLVEGDVALNGAALFSLAGSPELVSRAKALLEALL